MSQVKKLAELRLEVEQRKQELRFKNDAVFAFALLHGPVDETISFFVEQQADKKVVGTNELTNDGDFIIKLAIEDLSPKQNGKQNRQGS